MKSDCSKVAIGIWIKCSVDSSPGIDGKDVTDVLRISLGWQDEFPDVILDVPMSGTSPIAIDSDEYTDLGDTIDNVMRNVSRELQRAARTDKGLLDKVKVERNGEPPGKLGLGRLVVECPTHVDVATTNGKIGVVVVTEKDEPEILVTNRVWPPRLRSKTPGKGRQLPPPGITGEKKVKRKGGQWWVGAPKRKGKPKPAGEEPLGPHEDTPSPLPRYVLKGSDWKPLPWKPNPGIKKVGGSKEDKDILRKHFAEVDRIRGKRKEKKLREELRSLPRRSVHGGGHRGDLGRLWREGEEDAYMCMGPSMEETPGSRSLQGIVQELADVTGRRVDYGVSRSEIGDLQDMTGREANDEFVFLTVEPSAIATTSVVHIVALDRGQIRSAPPWSDLVWGPPLPYGTRSRPLGRQSGSAEQRDVLEHQRVSTQRTSIQSAE